VEKFTNGQDQTRCLQYTVTRVTGPVLWANLHLLFWLSLFPFATGWMVENHFARLRTAAYGLNVFCIVGGAACFCIRGITLAGPGLTHRACT
jgi:uncharacterized membrane protein